jgi:hypothetical protein
MVIVSLDNKQSHRANIDAAIYRYAQTTNINSRSILRVFSELRDFTASAP